jgi:hypothetical protein
MVYKSNISCLPKTHILCFMTPPLFTRFFKEIRSLSPLKCAKRGGAEKVKYVFLPYKKLLFYQGYAKNVRVPSKELHPLFEIANLTY